MRSSGSAIFCCMPALHPRSSDFVTRCRRFRRRAAEDIIDTSSRGPTPPPHLHTCQDVNHLYRRKSQRKDEKASDGEGCPRTLLRSSHAMGVWIHRSGTCLPQVRWLHGRAKSHVSRASSNLETLFGCSILRWI